MTEKNAHTFGMRVFFGASGYCLRQAELMME
jgi:hypothetical protein